MGFGKLSLQDMGAEAEIIAAVTNNSHLVSVTGTDTYL